MEKGASANLREVATMVWKLREQTKLQEAENDQQEGVKAPDKGFEHSRQAPYWVRGPARIIDGEIVLDESRAERYFMFEPKGLVFDLAGLADGNYPHSFLAFVRRYGLLWHGASDLGSGKCRESLVDWFEAIGGLRMTMGLYQSLGEAIRSGSLEPVRRLELPWPDEFVKEASDEEYLELTSRTVASLITRGLEDCRLGVVSTVVLDVEGRGPGAFKLSHSPPHLLAGAYAQLAMLVANRAELRECSGCGCIFHPESGKQKYCTKSCANTSRWRRWKERQAG